MCVEGPFHWVARVEISQVLARLQAFQLGARVEISQFLARAFTGFSPRCKSGHVTISCTFTCFSTTCKSGNFAISCTYTCFAPSCKSGKFTITCVFTHFPPNCKSGSFAIFCAYTWFSSENGWISALFLLRNKKIAFLHSRLSKTLTVLEHRFRLQWSKTGWKNKLKVERKF
jgi:hypothetical protein